MPPPTAKKRKLSHFKRGDIVFRVGDYVLAKSETPQPFIARIKGIRSSARITEAHLNWLYRPEEATGRKRFHGNQELFKSDHSDYVEVTSVMRKCRVHSLEKYKKLDAAGDDDFFARFTYLPHSKEFRPDSVPVYCVCEMPENPDKPMVLCDTCQDWYHPECLDYTSEEVKAMAVFVCRDCARPDVGSVA